MKQLCMESLLAPVAEPAVVLEPTISEEVVVQMSEAIAMVLQQEGVGADDEPCPEP